MKHLHEIRGISFAELGALLGVRVLLASGLFKHQKPDRRRDGTVIHHKTRDHMFNMATASCKNEHCGSVQCIGGAMAELLGHNHEEYVSTSHALSRLFYPPTQYDYYSIEPKQAVKAIDNFLQTGDPAWKKVLRRDQLDK